MTTLHYIVWRERRHARAKSPACVLLRRITYTASSYQISGMPDSLEIGSQDAAKRAGLRYVNDRTPGIRRRSRGKNFTYLRDASGERFTAKDFRTWVGTVAASCVLSQLREEDSNGTSKQHFDTAVKAVALHLGNTPAVCRKYYIHPGLADAHRDQSLFTAMPASRRRGLDPAERGVLQLLKRLDRQPRRK